MFCLEHFSLNCIIKMLNLKVNDPLNGFDHWATYPRAVRPVH